MQVQYNDSGEWVVDTTVVNDSLQVINSSEQLPLDQFFNGEVNTNNLSYGNGMYCVYAAFRDQEDNVLQSFFSFLKSCLNMFFTSPKNPEIE